MNVQNIIDCLILKTFVSVISNNLRITLENTKNDMILILLKIKKNKSCGHDFFPLYEILFEFCFLPLQ